MQRPTRFALRSDHLRAFRPDAQETYTPLSNLYVRMLQQTGIEAGQFGASTSVEDAV